MRVPLHVIFFLAPSQTASMMFFWIFFGKKPRAVSTPTPMPTVYGPDATPRAKAANVRVNVKAFTAAVACANKMVKDNDRVEFYPAYHDEAKFTAIRTRLPATGLNPMIRYNVY